MVEILKTSSEAPSGKSQGCSNLLTVFNVVNTCIGLGIIKLPGAVQGAGWVGGLLLLLGCGWIALYCMLLFNSALAKNASGKLVTSFEEMGRVTFGSAGAVSCWLAVYFKLYLLLVVILSLFGNALMILFPASLSLPEWTAVAAVLVTPLALLPSMSEVGWVSGLAVGSIALVVAVVVGASITHVADREVPAYTTAPPSFVDFAGSVAVFLLAYCCTSTTPTLLGGMRTPEDFPRVAKISFAVVIVLYILISVVGYASFGNELSNYDTMLTAISPDRDNPSVSSYILQSGVLVMVACHYMICFAPCGVVIDKMAISGAKTLRGGGDAPASPLSVRLVSQAGRVFFVLLTALPAVFIPDGKVGPLLTLTAALFSTSMTVLMPIVFYWRCLQQTGESHPSKPKLALEVGFVLLGLLAVVAGLMDGIDEAKSAWV